jgi:hypothetical protein
MVQVMAVQRVAKGDWIESYPRCALIMAARYAFELRSSPDAPDEWLAVVKAVVQQ